MGLIAWPVNSWNAPVSIKTPSLSSQGWDYKCTGPHTISYSRAKASYLRGKRFTHWAIAAASSKSVYWIDTHRKVHKSQTPRWTFMKWPSSVTSTKKVTISVPFLSCPPPHISSIVKTAVLTSQCGFFFPTSFWSLNQWTHTDCILVGLAFHWCLQAFSRLRPTEVLH